MMKTKTIQFLSVTVLLAAISACGGGGGNSNSVAAKGQKISFNDSQRKIVQVHVDAGKTGTKGVQGKINEDAALKLSILPSSAISKVIIASTQTVMVEQQAKNVNKDFNFKQTCGKSGTQEIQGSFLLNVIENSGEVSVKVSTKLDNCEEASGKVVGDLAFSFSAKGADKSGSATVELSGSTKATVQEAGIENTYSLSFNNFSVKISVDEALAKALSDENTKTVEQKKAAYKQLLENTECTGSITFEGKELACADLLTTAMDEEAGSIDSI